MEKPKKKTIDWYGKKVSVPFNCHIYPEKKVTIASTHRGSWSLDSRRLRAACTLPNRYLPLSAQHPLHVEPFTLTSLAPVIHAAAGRLNDGPGILDGALRPPVISLASFFNISFFLFLIFCHLNVFLLWRLKLAAWSLQLCASFFFSFSTSGCAGPALLRAQYSR